MGRKALTLLSLHRSVTVFYGTGITVGVIASLLILLYMFSRFVPKVSQTAYGGMHTSSLQNVECAEQHPRTWGVSRRLHTLCLLLLLVLEPCPGGYSHACVVSLSQLVSLQVAVKNLKYVIAYVTCAGLISFAVLYRMSPPSDERSLNLIQWAIQLVGVACIYWAWPLQEVGVVCVITVLILYNISYWSVMCTHVYRSGRRWFTLYLQCADTTIPRVPAGLVSISPILLSSGPILLPIDPFYLCAVSSVPSSLSL